MTREQLKFTEFFDDCNRHCVRTNGLIKDNTICSNFFMNVPEDGTVEECEEIIMRVIKDTLPPIMILPHNKEEAKYYKKETKDFIKKNIRISTLNESNTILTLMDNLCKNQFKVAILKQYDNNSCVLINKIIPADINGFFPWEKGCDERYVFMWNNKDKEENKEIYTKYGWKLEEKYYE